MKERRDLAVPRYFNLAYPGIPVSHWYRGARSQRSFPSPECFLKKEVARIHFNDVHTHNNVIAQMKSFQVTLFNTI